MDDKDLKRMLDTLSEFEVRDLENIAARIVTDYPVTLLERFVSLGLVKSVERPRITNWGLMVLEYYWRTK